MSCRLNFFFFFFLKYLYKYSYWSTRRQWIFKKCIIHKGLYIHKLTCISTGRLTSLIVPEFVFIVIRTTKDANIGQNPFWEKEKKWWNFVFSEVLFYFKLSAYLNRPWKDANIKHSKWNLRTVKNFKGSNRRFLRDNCVRKKINPLNKNLLIGSGNFTLDFPIHLRII